MKNNIINSKQKAVLSFISESNLKDLVYWSGGTALSECYLKHRISTDIDLFSYELIDTICLQIFIKSIKKKLNIKNIEHRISMNRNLYVLDNLKLEIVYFPFKSLDEKIKYSKLSVDSLIDIACNKTLALYQRKDPKDVFDLYYIFKNTDLDFSKLIKMTEIKFEEKLDESLLYAKLQKLLSEISVLKPLVFDKNVFIDIKEYFTKKNKTFLFNILI